MRARAAVVIVALVDRLSPGRPALHRLPRRKPRSAASRASARMSSSITQTGRSPRGPAPVMACDSCRHPLRLARAPMATGLVRRPATVGGVRRAGQVGGLVREQEQDHADLLPGGRAAMFGIGQREQARDFAEAMLLPLPSATWCFTNS